MAIQPRRCATRHAAMWIWQLPQHILGLIVLTVVRRHYQALVRRALPYDARLYRFDPRSHEWGVSLGNYVFLSTGYDHVTIRHEYGHCRQSRLLGPLYLIVVGVPSIIRATYWWIRRLPARDYYRGYPEAWADRLAGVRRDD